MQGAQSLELKRRISQKRRLFVCIGAVPNIRDWADQQFARTGDTDGAADQTERLPLYHDEAGYLLTGPDLFVGGERPASWTPDRNPCFLET